MVRDDPLVRRKKGFKETIRHFAPSWFAVIMGTGAISILSHAFPYGNETEALTVLTFFFFFLNLVLFTLFTAITVARYILFPDVWTIMLHHPVQSLYVGCFPMAAATLINVSVSLIYEKYAFGGDGFLFLLWVFWWLDILVSILCCWGMVHIMSTAHFHTLERMSAAWLLPVVTLIVASSSGGVLASPLLDRPLYALVTLTVSTFMVTIGLSLALMMLTTYLLRLIVYGPPPGSTIISAFLPLGPTGQAGYAFLLIGSSFKQLLPLQGVPPDHFMGLKLTGEIIYVICVCIAFALWSLASMWLLFALLGFQSVVRRTRFAFKVPFWGLIFPNGVYANLTIALSKTLDSSFFKIYGSIYSVLVLILWIIVAFRTTQLVKTAEIFEAPCLEDIDMTRRATHEMDNVESTGVPAQGSS